MDRNPMPVNQKRTAQEHTDSLGEAGVYLPCLRISEERLEPLVGFEIISSANTLRIELHSRRRRLALAGLAP